MSHKIVEDVSIDADIMDNMFGDDEVDLDDKLQTTSSLTKATKIPIAYVKDIDDGKAMGCFASRDIAVGELIMTESPTFLFNQVNWTNKEELCGLICRLCVDSKAYEVLSCLYPRTLGSSLLSEYVEMEEFLIKDTIQSMSSTTSQSYDDIIRVALVLKHNGFASGLYRWLTMINHSCRPNCIKFAPTLGSSMHSEVWAISPIQAGEEVTINYCEVAEMSKSARQDFLYSHHSFHCVCKRCQVELCMSEDEVEASFQIDTMLREARDSINNALTLSYDLQVLVAKSILDEFHDYEVPSSWHHLCSLKHMIIVRASSTILSSSDHINSIKQASSFMNHSELLLAFAHHAILLLYEKLQYEDPSHPDFAEYHFHVANAIDALVKSNEYHRLNFPDIDISCCHVDLSSAKQAMVSVRFHNTEAKSIQKLYAIKQRYPEIINLRQSGATIHWNS